MNSGRALPFQKGRARAEMLKKAYKTKQKYWSCTFASFALLEKAELAENLIESMEN